MKLCDKCLNELTCAYADMEISSRHVECTSYERDYRILNRFKRKLAFLYVLIIIKLRECRHLCCICPYRITCWKAIHYEMKLAEVKNEQTKL